MPDRRAVGVVEQALGEVRGRRHVLEALLVLDADGVAAEAVGDAHRGGVQPQLVEHLVLGQLGGAVAAEPETASRDRVSHSYAACASAVVTSRISATSADWLSRSLRQPGGVEVARRR